MSDVKGHSFDFRTLETGHAVRSRRGDVSRDTVETLAPIVHAGGGAVAGIEVRFVESSDGADAVFDIHAPGMGRIARCYLGYDEPEAMKAKIRTDHSRDAAESLGDGCFLAVSLSHGSQTLLSGLAEAPKLIEVLSMAGDFERCVAWTLIAGHRPTRH